MDKPRNFYKNTFHHIYNRGANKNLVFFERNDYLYFQRKLIEYKEKYSILILSYCLMPNHYHLFVKQTEEDKSISQFISGLSNSFTKGMNKKYKRSGVLFESKFKSKQIEDETYFKWVIKYILENPLKAGLVEDIRRYKFSSFWEINRKVEKPITDGAELLSYFDSYNSFYDFIMNDKLKNIYEP